MKVIELKDQVPGNQDQVGEVRRQVIHRGHRPDQVLPQVHQHPETMAVEAEAVVQADQVADVIKKEWSYGIYENA